MNCRETLLKLVKNTSIFRKKEKEIHRGLKPRCVNSYAIRSEGQKQWRSSRFNFSPEQRPPVQALHLLSAAFIQRRVILTADAIHTELFHVAGVTIDRLFWFWNIFMVSTHRARLSSKWKSVLWWTWPILISPALCSVTLKSASPLLFGFPSSVKFCIDYSMLQPQIHSHSGGSRVLKIIQRWNVQI